MVPDQPLEALHHYGRECYMAVIIETCYCGLFWYWYDGGSLETRWDNSLVQRGVEDVSRDVPADQHIP